MSLSPWLLLQVAFAIAVHALPEAYMWTPAVCLKARSSVLWPDDSPQMGLLCPLSMAHPCEREHARNARWMPREVDERRERHSKVRQVEVHKAIQVDGGA